jgi:hypothetical protein
MSEDRMWAPDKAGWTVDRVLAAINPHIREGIFYRAVQARSLYVAANDHLDPREYYRMRDLIEERVARGATEHNFDLWKQRPSIDQLLKEAREEAADEIVYFAMLARLMKEPRDD